VSVDRLESWALKRRDSPDAIEMVELVNLSAMSMVPAVVLATWHAPVDMKAIALDAYEDSLTHAEANVTQGPQRYALRIFCASNPRRPKGQFVWMHEPGETVGEVSGMTGDPPNATGLLQIAMRALNDTTKAAGGAWKDIYQVQKVEIAALRARVSELEGERVQLWETAESIYQRKHERDLDNTRLLAAEARKAEMLGTFKQLVPAIGGRIMQHFGLPTNTADVAALDQVFASFTEEQFGAINALLTVPQRIALLELLKRREAATRPAGEAAPASANTKGGSNGGSSDTH
jgi:hypothetical protein